MSLTRTCIGFSHKVSREANATSVPRSLGRPIVTAPRWSYGGRATAIAPARP